MSVDPRRTSPFCTPRCYRECRCSRWPDYKNRFGEYVVPHDDSAPWTPALPLPVSGLLPEHWYRVELGRVWQDAGVTPAVSAGDPIGRLEDRTANADHVNQANAGNKPTLQAGPNGTLVARFDGIDDYLQGAFTTGGVMTQPNTVFGVVQLGAAKVNDDSSLYWADGDDVGHRGGIGKTGATAPDKWSVYNGLALQGNACNANWNIWTVLQNGAASQFWHNGISEAVGNAGASNPDGLTMGSIWSLAGNFWLGDAAEIIFYDANLSNADKNTVGNYLATRYALAYTDI